MGELMYGVEKQVATKRIARILKYLALLFRSTASLQNASKFM